jgi:hypothetical protein
MSTKTFSMLGSTLIARDKVLAIRPNTGTRFNTLEVTCDNGQTVSIIDADPNAAIQSYFSDGPTATWSTEDRVLGAMNSTSDVET